MGFVTLPAFGADPVTVTGPLLDGKVDPLATEFNGGIENVNIKAAAGIVYSKLNLTGSVLNADISLSAAIVDTKLATISTASKVSGAALGSLSSIPSGAGIIPVANLASGTPTGTKFIRDDGTFQAITVTAATALSGSIVQSLYTSYATKTQLSTAIPFDDTIPQSTEGTQILSQAITPNSSSNYIEIQVVLNATSDSATPIAISLLQDSTASALCANWFYNAASAHPVQLTLFYRMTAGTTSATTFKINCGSSSGNVTINGENNGRIGGGVQLCAMFVKEVKA